MTTPTDTFKIIQWGSYAAALLAVGGLCTAVCDSNARASDLQMEKRMLTRSITQWATKPATTVTEKQYKKVILQQLESDKEDIGT